jgi:hypothetical protein
MAGKSPIKFRFYFNPSGTYVKFNFANTIFVFQSGFPRIRLDTDEALAVHRNVQHIKLTFVLF